MKGKYIIAGLLIILGVGLLLDQNGVWTFGRIIGTWWPLILIGVGASSMMNSNGSFFPGGILILIGILFQANNLDFLPGSVWGYFWPLILILIGVGLLFNRKNKHHSKMFRDDRSASDDNFVQINTLFSGVEHKVTSQNFVGGKIDCAFGGVELDLTKIRIAPEGAELNISVAFGGIEIRVPENIICEVKGTPFLGGFENKTHQMNTDSTQILRIKYSVAFGGFELKN